ncbi:MAG: hypothetical protein FJZ62_05920 [Chlamydiae bacterium]|nr:hypothetical protein [Chlamydiota bacterium]
MIGFGWSLFFCFCFFLFYKFLFFNHLKQINFFFFRFFFQGYFIIRFRELKKFGYLIFESTPK